MYVCVDFCFQGRFRKFGVLLLLFLCLCACLQSSFKSLLYQNLFWASLAVETSSHLLIFKHMYYSSKLGHITHSELSMLLPAL